MGLWVLAQQGKLPPDMSAKAWTYAILVLGLLVGLLTGVLLNNAFRRSRRKRESEEQRLKATAEPAKDPWVEAGKRAATPTSSELERGARAPAPQIAGERAAPVGRPVALVTGAARRVGRAIALKLAEAGCDVYFTYHESEEEAQDLAGELSRLGSTGSFHQV